jgi:formylglycine-generating enzyme required for sulfatase activity
MTPRKIVAILFFELAVFSSYAQVQAPGTAFRDCADCPEMVVLPPGEFVMGSTEGGSSRYRNYSIPTHEVAIAKPFAVGRTEITRGQYGMFMRESGHTMGKTFCWYWNERKMQSENYDSEVNWLNPGHVQQDDHPVVCVDWHDAKAYAAWLEKKTGKRYRLLTEAEWEYAARAGTATPRPWGDDASQACRFANVLDATAGKAVGGATGKVGSRRELHDCDDGFSYTAPVGRFQPNSFGLYDMIGNVSEWTEDCWNFSFKGAPVDGSAWLGGDCTLRAVRGGNWFSQPEYARSASRNRDGVDARDQLRGFRIARTLP